MIYWNDCWERLDFTPKQTKTRVGHQFHSTRQSGININAPQSPFLSIQFPPKLHLMRHFRHEVYELIANSSTFLYNFSAADIVQARAKSMYMLTSLFVTHFTVSIRHRDAPGYAESLSFCLASAIFRMRFETTAPLTKQMVTFWELRIIEKVPPIAMRLYTS